MKILIASTFIPPIAGGAENVVWETAVRLTSYKDVEVHIATIGNKKFEIRDRVRIHYFPIKPLLTIYYSLIGKKRIDSLFDENKFDIIHVHILLPWLYLFRNMPGKKVLTCHGDEVYNIRWYQQYFTKKAVQNADAITSPSIWLQEIAKKSFKMPVKYIPNGVDTKIFVPGKGKVKDYVFYYGRYIERKGFLELVNAARSLPQYKFVFAGAGPLSKIIDRPNMKDLGFKSGPSLVKLIQEAKICVFPSHWENMPLVGLEAMSCGKAIIATEKGFSEIIENGKNGIIIEAKNTESLKNQIISLMENDRIRHHLENNARKKSAIFDWNSITKEYYELYLSLLKNK